MTRTRLTRLVTGALLGWSLLGATPTPRAKHVNIHPGVLHVWHCLDGDVTPDFTANGDTI